MCVVPDGFRRPSARTIVVVALSDARHPPFTPERTSQDVFEFVDAALFFAPHAVRTAFTRTLVVLASLDYAHRRPGTHTNRGKAVPRYEHLIRLPAWPDRATKRRRRGRGSRGR